MSSRPQKSTQPPTISAAKAVELLGRQIKLAEDVTLMQYNDPRVDRWENDTEAYLTAAYGLPGGELHRNTAKFAYAHAGSAHVDMRAYELQVNHVKTTKLRVALLEGFAGQLRDLSPPSAAVASDDYRFHPQVEAVSGALFCDGHYEQAALAAYICVIDAVRQRSGLTQDGDDLMNRAFGSDGRTPVLQVNTLETDFDRNEQRGFMYLFKGLVGLRNLKAHTNRPFNDPARAHEYLGLASLLLRIIELSSMNPVV